MGVKQRTKSLKAKSHKLSDTFYQLNVLNGKDKSTQKFKPFLERVSETTGIEQTLPLAPEVLQINIGKLCNQTCAHCHVDAGPDRKEENMSRETLEKCLNLLKTHSIKIVDITGGAPEMNAHFKWFVEQCTSMNVQVLNRCNLTIIRANKKYHQLPEFFKKHNVHVISSLPYFNKNRTDSQRGDGVFEDSIQALKDLNAVGYGIEGTGLKLDLVYNPAGAFLPGDQFSIENEFKRQLARKHGIYFNHLFAITNLPIARFLDYLLESEKFESYMEELVNAFNPSTISGLMCRNTISVSWDGYIYDCDFNQMLDLKVDTPGVHLDTFNMDEFISRKIVFNQHCYGCTAGSGSSCGGEIA